MVPDSDPLLDFSALTEGPAWDRVAAGYADVLAHPFGTYAQTAMDLVGLRPEHRVIDVATGPGTLALRAATVAPVDAVDFSHEMLSVLNERANALGLSNVTAHQADGHALPFDDDTFDVGFSMFGLFLFRDRAEGFAELARVVRPGGQVVVSSWQPRATSGVLHELSHALWQATGADGEMPTAGPLSDPDEFRTEMQAAGFEVTLHSVHHTVSGASVADLFEQMERAHVGLGIARDQLGAKGYAALRERIVAQLTANLSPGEQTVPMPAWLAHGTRRVHTAQLGVGSTAQ